MHLAAGAFGVVLFDQAPQCASPGFVQSQGLVVRHSGCHHLLAQALHDEQRRNPVSNTGVSGR